MREKTTVPEKTWLHRARAGNGKIHAACLVPANGGSEITHYEFGIAKYQSVSDAIGEDFMISVSSEPRHTFTGLTNGQWYGVFASAVNEYGPAVRSMKMMVMPDRDAADDVINVDESLPLMMTFNDVQTGLNGLVGGGLVLPYGRHPMVLPGKDCPVITQRQWLEMNWNPPWSRPGLSEPDAAAGDKPSWSALSTSREGQEAVYARAGKLDQLRTVCRDMIVKAYGEDNETDEIFKRLRGDSTPAMDATAAHLRSRYKTCQNEIANMSADAIGNLDISSNEYWGVQWDDALGHLIVIPE